VTCVLLGGNTHIELYDKQEINMVFAMPDEARPLSVSGRDSTQYGGSEYERLLEVWQLLLCYNL
jgi:hypothetical protein